MIVCCLCRNKYPDFFLSCDQNLHGCEKSNIYHTHLCYAWNPEWYWTNRFPLFFLNLIQKILSNYFCQPTCHITTDHICKVWDVVSVYFSILVWGAENSLPTRKVTTKSIEYTSCISFLVWNKGARISHVSLHLNPKGVEAVTRKLYLKFLMFKYFPSEPLPTECFVSNSRRRFSVSLL